MFVFPGALGDFLLALPTIRSLQRRHDAATTLVVSDAIVPVARLAGGTEVARLDGADSAGLFGGEAEPPWLRRATAVYSWLGARDPEARRRITARAARATFAAVERAEGAVHAAIAYARAVGVDEHPDRLRALARLAIPDSPTVDALRERLPAPLLVVHPGAGARRKRWAAAGFVAVAAWWYARGGSVVEIVGPAEVGARALPDGVGVEGWSLPDVAALLGTAAVYVGNDSGVSHLAGAVGARGVVLFGPTRAARWRPFAGRLAALQAVGQVDDGIGLHALPPARVIAACADAIAVDKPGTRY